MKYSIVFCYRDRETHLNIILPQIRKLFAGKDFEIIVAEQNDNKKFRRANLLNAGANVATGDILILHDVDYYPSDTVEYYDGVSDVFLPVKRVEFVHNDMTPKKIEDVPGGYRHFKDSVDDNFFGGISVFTREAFQKINGFSPKFIGWGFEDADLRERVYLRQLKVARHPSNLFYALEHPDSGPPMTDPDFRQNIMLSQQTLTHLHSGASNQPVTLSIADNYHPLVDLWIKCTDFDPPPPPTHIVASTFTWEDDE
jgi:N-terminal domain of galactosyltransferase/N-terminal region of glycosyl transferase group 7